MGVINILDKQTANMIAAGEVVDRPSGALKELLENCIDAGATSIKIEIRGGGMSMIKVSDNGCGIERDDVPKTLLRHATSKITCGADLDGVTTMGFRGEALAAISAVSRVEITTRRQSDTEGTHLVSDENGVIIEDVGCPVGTTVTVKDLFYNTPARARFMKRDQAEAASCAAAAEKIALANPDVAIAFYSENDRKFATPGDGRLFSAIYSVFGSQTSKTLSECSYELEDAGIKVSGFISRPESPRSSRTMQVFFVNRRFVISKTIKAALEEAYRSFIPQGKFPAGILYITLDAHLTDVNVHPAKLEIKFADEKKIFEAVYYCVRNALQNGSRRQEAEIAAGIAHTATESQAATQRADFYQSNQNNQTGQSYQSYQNYQSRLQKSTQEASRPQKSGYAPSTQIKGQGIMSYSLFDGDIASEDATPDGNPIFSVRTPIPVEEPSVAEPEQKKLLDLGDTDVVIVGELYKTYVIAQTHDTIMIFDKHAAHERIIYERLITEKVLNSQHLLTGVVVCLDRESVALIADNMGYLNQFGFCCEPFGDDAIIVRTVPNTISKCGDIQGIIESFAKDLAEGSALPFKEKVDKALYTVACKAAVKAGQHTGPEQDLFLARKLIADPSLKLCPHGRPFVREYPRSAIDKLFDR